MKAKSVHGIQNSDWPSVETAYMTTRLNDHGQAYIIYSDLAKDVVLIQYVVNNEYFSNEIQA